MLSATKSDYTNTHTRRSPCLIPPLHKLTKTHQNIKWHYSPPHVPLPKTHPKHHLTNGIIRRHMFPPREAYGPTINSAQGLTINNVIFDGKGYNSKGFSLPYVGMSRVKTFKGLRVRNIPHSAAAFNAMFNILRIHALQRELTRLRSLEL